MTVFSQRLRFLRKQHRLTQKQLGDKVGVSGPTVTRWEQGKFEPDTAKLKEIADLFGVTVDYLLGRDEKEEKKEKNIVDLREAIKKRPYVIDPETGEAHYIPEERLKIINDLIEGYLREQGILPNDSEDCANSS